MTTHIEKRLFSTKEYYKMLDVGILSVEDRVELINGEIIQMSPIKSQHAGIVNFLHRFLNKALETKASISSQNPLHINDYNEPEPDVLISKYREDDYRFAHPTAKDVFCVIEVADSSLEYDRQVKKVLYAKAGINEYWIVNIIDKRAEVFRNLKEEQYQTVESYTASDIIKCHSIDFEIEVSAIFL